MSSSAGFAFAYDRNSNSNVRCSCSLTDHLEYFYFYDYNYTYCDFVFYDFVYRLGLLFDYVYYDYYSIIPITITIISMTRILTSFRDSVEVDTIRTQLYDSQVNVKFMSGGVAASSLYLCARIYVYTSLYEQYYFSYLNNLNIA